MTEVDFSSLCLQELNSIVSEFGGHECPNPCPPNSAYRVLKSFLIDLIQKDNWKRQTSFTPSCGQKRPRYKQSLTIFSRMGSIIKMKIFLQAWFLEIRGHQDVRVVQVRWTLDPRKTMKGAIRHLPIILLKHFKDANLNLTDLILSLLEKNTPDAQNLFQNLEAFLGSASFRNQKAEAERRINVKNATVKNYRHG